MIWKKEGVDLIDDRKLHNFRLQVLLMRLKYKLSYECFMKNVSFLELVTSTIYKILRPREIAETPLQTKEVSDMVRKL